MHDVGKVEKERLFSSPLTLEVDASQGNCSGVLLPGIDCVTRGSRRWR